jgi:hypothetical protein
MLKIEKKSTKTQIHVRLPNQLVERINDNAILLGIDGTAVIQAAIAQYFEMPEQMPIILRYADIERRIYDLELIMRSRPKQKNG